MVKEELEKKVDGEFSAADLVKGKISVGQEIRETLNIEKQQTFLIWVDDEEEKLIGMKPLTNEDLKEILQ